MTLVTSLAPLKRDALAPAVPSKSGAPKKDDVGVIVCDLVAVPDGVGATDAVIDWDAVVEGVCEGLCDVLAEPEPLRVFVPVDDGLCVFVNEDVPDCEGE